MKGFTLLLITAVLWYFSGTYRQTNIMAVAVCILIILLLMLILSVYQLCRFKVRLPKDKQITFKGFENSISVFAENKSILPVNKYKLSLSVKYENGGKPVKKRFTGCAAGKKMKGGNQAEFFVTAPYCGIIDVEMKRLRVYDFLSIFSFSKKAKGNCQLLVLPAAKNMKICFPTAGSHDDIPVSDIKSKKQGYDHSEVRLIREYRPGDLSRYIHHNYSAKTDSLWIKEYYKDNDFIFDLYLDTSSFSNASAEIWDAFYEITCSMIVSLLRKDFSIHVHWFDRSKNCLIESEINSEADCPELLSRIYLTDKNCTKDAFYDQIDSDAAGSMVLNLDLEWKISGRTVYRFDPQKTEAELENAVFIL